MAAQMCCSSRCAVEWSANATKEFADEAVEEGVQQLGKLRLEKLNFSLLDSCSFVAQPLRPGSS